MTESANLPPVPQRLSTGIVGLDRILGGGLFTSCHYLLMGEPGAGKTILSNQLCFQHLATGGRVIYLSLLAETNSRLLTFLQSFSFFRPELIGDSLLYLSGSSVLQNEGIDGLLSLLRNEIRRHRATLLIIDGTSALGPSTDHQKWMNFLYSLYISAEIYRCTTLLLTQSSNELEAEQTVVDGVIEFITSQVNMRSVREVRVRKFRGSSFLEGRHSYAITGDGITVYPRIETIYKITSPAPDAVNPLPSHRELLPFGISSLDVMLQGGLPTGSTTLILGTSGTGKTLLGSHFLLEGVSRNQTGLYYGFYEKPEQLEYKLARFNLDVKGARERGLLQVLWQSPVQDILDALADQILERLKKGGLRRLFLDGLGGFRRTTASAERLDLFLAALLTKLSEQGITTVCSVELPSLFSPSVDLPSPFEGTLALVDNLFFLRYVELQSQLYRLFSVLKMRDSGYDPSIREFRITDQGIDVAPTFASAQAILTGNAQPTLPGSFAQSSTQATARSSGELS